MDEQPASCLATVEWQAHLLAAQRDRLLAHCRIVESAGRDVISLEDVYSILITDPGDDQE